MKTYTVGPRNYTLSPLVIGQVSRLLSELKGVEIFAFDALSLATAFGSRLPKILACILVPEGDSPAKVDTTALAELLFEMPADVAMGVLDDFLSMVDLGSVSTRLTQILDKIAGNLPTATTGPETSVLSSPVATP